MNYGVARGLRAAKIASLLRIYVDSEMVLIWMIARKSADKSAPFWMLKILLKVSICLEVSSPGLDRPFLPWRIANDISGRE